MIFTTLLFAVVRMEQAAEDKRLSAEVQARHLETAKRMEADQKKWDEISAIAHAKIGTPEFIVIIKNTNNN